MALYYDPTTKRAKLVVYIRGEQRQRTKTWRTSSLRAAKRDERRYHDEIDADELARKQRARTVDGLIDEWCKHRDPVDSPSTIRGRTALIRRIRDRFGTTLLDEITAHDVDAWYDDLRTEGLAPNTVANARRQLRAILRQGELWDMCTDRAVRQASKLAPRTRQFAVLPAPALNVLIDTATPDLRLCAHLAAVTGLRRGELLALQWPDIHGTSIAVWKAIVVGDGGMTVKDTKTGRSRTVEIDADTAAMLAAHRAELEQRAGLLGDVLHPGGFVVADIAADPTGRTPRHPNWLTLSWSRHCARHGVTMRFHDLRHWHASQLLDAGRPVLEVSRRLGHASTKMTLDVYGSLIEGGEGDKEAARVVQRRRALNP